MKPAQKPAQKTRTSQYLLAKALKTDGSPTKLAELLKISKSSVRSRLKIFERNGWAISNFGAWELTKKGVRAVLGDGGGKTRTVEIRPHHLTVSIVHKMDKEIWKKNFVGTMIKLYIPKIDKEIDFRFTPKGVQFNLVQQKTGNLVREIREINSQVYEIILKLERHTKAHFVRPSDLGIKKLYEELAYLNTGLAESEIQEGRKIWLYNWEADGKPRFVFDKSKQAEFELTGKYVDDDTLETAYFLEMLGSGEFREALQDVRKIKNYVPELARSLNRLSFGEQRDKLILELWDCLHAGDKNGMFKLLEELALIDDNAKQIGNIFFELLLKQEVNNGIC